MVFSIQIHSCGLGKDLNFEHLSADDRRLDVRNDEALHSRRADKTEKRTLADSFSDIEIDDFELDENDLKQLERIESPQKLPNGNTRCNHTCKDRMKLQHFLLDAKWNRCRHLCCKEGKISSKRKRDCSRSKTANAQLTITVSKVSEKQSTGQLQGSEIERRSYIRSASQTCGDGRRSDSPWEMVGYELKPDSQHFGESLYEDSGDEEKEAKCRKVQPRTDGAPNGKQGDGCDQTFYSGLVVAGRETLQDKILLSDDDLLELPEDEDSPADSPATNKSRFLASTQLRKEDTQNSKVSRPPNDNSELMLDFQSGFTVDDILSCVEIIS